MSSRVNNNTNHTQQTIASFWVWLHFIYRWFPGETKIILIFCLSDKIAYHHPPSRSSRPKGAMPFRPLWGRCGSRIWSRGGPGSEAKSCRHSEVESLKRSEQFVAEVQGLLKGPGSFWVFNAQKYILPHSRDSFSLIFDNYFNTKSWSK